MEQTIYGAAIAAVSFIMGLWAGLSGRHAYIQSLRDGHALEKKEMETEIKRLRAQNAMLIGKESE